MSMCSVVVEVRLSSQSRAKKKEVRALATSILSTRTVFRSGRDDALLTELAPRFEVDFVQILLPMNEREVPYFRASLSVFVYRLSQTGPTDERVTDEGDGSTTTLFSHRILPAAEYEGVWESLVLEEGIKEKLIAYADSGLLFADHDVDPRAVSCNRVILLHGPPGTGKTSLCQGLAQKIAIYNGSRYSRGAHVLEVNAHALFSRWFSESGKLVSKMFEMVRELAAERNSLVFVLIDEVESLTTSRGRNSQADPSDAVRVVNSMLTQIDKLKDYPNVMLLATSNVTEQIDAAFLDRADVRLFLGNPGLAARRRVLASCMKALMVAGIVQPNEDVDEDTSNDVGGNKENADSVGYWLNRCAEASQGMSGRALRKLPLQAHAFYVREHCTRPEKMAKALYQCITDVRVGDTQKAVNHDIDRTKMTMS